jgi:TPR repeat protein
MKRVRFFHLWVTVPILVCVATVSAQSKGIDPALLAKAKAGDADAEFWIGLSLGNKKEASHWIIMSAKNGKVEAQFLLGEMYENGSEVLPKDYALAAFWIRKAAEQGDVDAQDELASLYYNGQGVSQDYSQAAIWWRKAAEQGEANSQYNLGLAYNNGQGVPQDYAQAVVWLRKVAEQGKGSASAPDWIRSVNEELCTRAQDALGRAYAYGHGVPQDYTQATAWYRKAAEKGNLDAQRDLGDLYDNGGVLKMVDAPGVGKRLVRDDGGGPFPKDFALAAMWYRKAAEQGDAYSQNNLGALYDSGQGVPQDYSEAYFWYSLAAARWPAGSAENRDNAAANLTKTVLLQTQERTRKWFEDHPVQTNSQ